MADSNVGGAALMGDHQSRKSTAATSHQAPQRGQPISNVPSSRSQSADWLHLPQWGHRWNGGTSPSSRAGQLLEAPQCNRIATERATTVCYGLSSRGDGGYQIRCNPAFPGTRRHWLSRRFPDKMSEDAKFALGF